MAVQLPPCPVSLRSVQHYLKTASDYDQRDPVISYWCRLYALQSALKIDKSSAEAKVLLMALMDWLEKQKRAMSENESVSNDMAANAYIENAALKLFLFADGQDRAANFGKDVVKAFYTSGLLFDVLTSFGELSEEIAQNRKYAKWKAAYIHKCLKNGETPQSGPMHEEGDEGQDGPLQPGFQQPGFQAPGLSGAPQGGFSQPQLPPRPSDQFSFPDPPSNFPTGASNFPPSASNFPPPGSNFTPSPHSNPYNHPTPPHYVPPTSPVDQPAFPIFPSGGKTAGDNQDYALRQDGSVKLTADQMTKAQKYCKWAGSSLTYDDVSTAVLNLKKALRLLETGVDS